MTSEENRQAGPPRPRLSEIHALVSRAEEAVRLSGTDPRLALTEARAVLDLARGRPEGAYGEAVSVALRASALAARELGDLELAEERLREAIGAGRGRPLRVAQARMSLVAVRALLGDPEGGLRLADLAEWDLAGTDRARLDVQRSVALGLLGRHEEAARRCDRAIGLLDGDPRFQAGGLLNRGVALVYLRRYGRAEADLAECARIARAAGLDHLAMLAEGNLPFVAARRGDIAAAFARYRAAESSLFGYPERLAAMRADFAEALVAARLPGEARTLLEQAVPELVAAGAQAAIPGARLLLAQAALLAGDAGLAETTARTALAELDAQGRTALLPLATDVMLRARLAEAAQDGSPGDRPGAGLIADMVACADELAASGRAGASSALRLTAADAAVRAGLLSCARTQLDLLSAGAAPPAVRRHAAAMRHRMDGDLDAALAAAGPDGDDGRAWDGGRAGDGDIHVLLARPAEELAGFALEIALDRALKTGDAWPVLEWAERRRAAVRGAQAPAFLRPETLKRTEGRLVELVRRGDDLFAVTAGRDGCVLRPLGSYQRAVEATVRIRYGLRRRILGDTAHPPGTWTADEGLALELAALDRLLLPDLASGDGDGASGNPAEPGRPPEEDTRGGDPGLAGPVTVVPAGALCTLPWPLLPSLRGRPASVAADASAWFAPRPRPSTDALRHPAPPVPGPVLSVAGPGLGHAVAEAGLVAATHRRAGRSARRIGATRAEVLRALETAGVLHVAAHGMFSPRGPMLSQITLDDGPLMAYDLLTARRVPRLVVLSACDAGMAHAPADGAALGLAGMFLDRGAACVVAGVVPVRDDEALTLMALFHTLLAEGRSPAEALALASRKSAVPGFVCFGRGDEAAAS